MIINCFERPQISFALNSKTFIEIFGINMEKSRFLYIEILGVLLLENSIAWETKRFFCA